MKLPRHVREALSKLRISTKQVTATVTGGTHLRLDVAGAARAVFTSMTPSCPHAHKHVAADIKKVLR